MNHMRELREERQLTTRDIEEQLNISHSSMSLYELEKREPSIGVAKKLAIFFEVSIDYLLNHSSYCLYALYKEGKFSFRIRENYYKELKEKKYIYFDNNNHRCIDINSLIGVDKSNDIIDLIQEFERMERSDALFNNYKTKYEDFAKFDGDFDEIELTRGLVNRIKEAIQ